MTQALMKIDGFGNLGQELRQLAGDLSARQALELSELDRRRVSNLGELLLLAADLADDLDGVPTTLAEAPPEVVDGVFDHIVFHEWPDGTEGEAHGAG
jgi:hypothetical protein